VLTRRVALKRSRLRKQSAKARAMAPARKACITKIFLRSTGWCEAMCCRECTGVGQDAHEKLPRSQGGSPFAPSNCLWVCRKCHDFIHAHPADSYRLGLLARRREGTA
jgi:hypothetical protein